MLTKPKKITNKQRTALKKKSIELAKKIIRLRQACEKCPKTTAQGWQMHGAHIIPVAYEATAADLNNILCLCATCHSMGPGSSHQNPIPFGRWFDEKWPGRYDDLHHKAITYSQNPFPKQDWQAIYDDLKAVEADLTNL